jgi:hypothetical protein
MTDRKGIPAHQNLFHQQSQNFLTLGHLQGVGPQAQLGAEFGERLDQPQALGIICGGRFQRLPFGLNRLLLFAEFRHPAAQLVQAHQTFLISAQQAVHALLQPGVVLAQYLLLLLPRIRMAGRFPPAIQFLLNHAGIFQQTQEFLPDHGIKVVLANRRIITNRSLQVTIRI